MGFWSPVDNHGKSWQKSHKKSQITRFYRGFGSVFPGLQRGDVNSPKQKAPRGAGRRACSCGHEQVSTGNFGGPAGVASLTCWGQNKSSSGGVGDSNPTQTSLRAPNLTKQFGAVRSKKGPLIQQQDLQGRWSI
jgi:hypothetical protein